MVSDPLELLALFQKTTRRHAIILLDKEAKIIFWIGGSKDIFGYESSEVLGKHFSMLFTPEDISRGVPDYEIAAALSGSEAEDDRWMLRKDGVRFWATGVLSPLHDEQRRVKGYSKILRNRTELKGIMEAVEERSAAVHRASEAKNNFILTLAHELRNPISAARFAIEILKKDTPSHHDRGRAYDSARRQLENASKLIEDLLDRTRVGLGKITLERKKVSLVRVVEAAAETCRGAIAERSQRLHFLAVNAPTSVGGDDKRLEQVFVNLIQNASKFTPPCGEIWVKIDTDGESAVVKVEDSGLGISPEMLPRIFDLFTQSADPDESRGGGLGIGLSVVRDLVTLHGGTVSVTSDGIGKGSSFVVRVPLLRSPSNLQ